MKKFISFFMAVALLILLCGCGAKSLAPGERPQEIREELYDYACDVIQAADDFINYDAYFADVYERAFEAGETYTNILASLPNATMFEWEVNLLLGRIASGIVEFYYGFLSFEELVSARNEAVEKLNYPNGLSVK